MKHAENGKSIFPLGTVKASAKWLRNRAKKLKKITDEAKS